MKKVMVNIQIISILLSIILILFLVGGCTIDLTNKEISNDKVITKKDKTTSTMSASSLSCTPPQVSIGGKCCVDADKNNACDEQVVVAGEFCGNGICSDTENECSCPTDCGLCSGKQADSCYAFACKLGQCVQELQLPCCGDALCNTGETCNSCSQDCCTAPTQDLADYPYLVEGFPTVVGDKSQVQNVIIAADILTAMAMENLKVGKGLLSSEVALNQNMIVVGNPCENPMAKKLFTKEIVQNAGDCQVFSPGESIVKVIPTSDSTFALYVGGYSPVETDKAAQELINYKDTGLIGSSIQVN
jgi:hypothetical protein